VRRDGDPYTVGAVDRALALMTLVSERGRVGVHEAAREIGVAPSTVHRLFSTLCEREYLVQGEDRRYRPGPELLGRRAAAGIPRLVREARPFLAELHARVDETVHLMVLVGTKIRLVDGIESNHDVRVALRLGAEFPAHATAGGKAILAELDRDSVAARYANGVPAGPGHGPTSLENLLDELEAHGDRRAWFNVDQTEVGLSIISASLSSPAREPRAAMSIGLPTARFHAADHKKMAAELIEVCQRARRYLED
jgi:DNA-binding IclR family transcriptional regulator